MTVILPADASPDARLLVLGIVLGAAIIVGVDAWRALRRR